MKYKLIKPINPNYSAIEQVLTNRGIEYNNIKHYLHTTNEDINEPELLGEDKLKAAAITLIKTIQNEKDVYVIVDCDCDGFTSSALLINYLYKLFPSWVENHLRWYMHEGKQHGLNDCIDFLLNKKPDLVIIPDAGSSDFVEHQKLKEQGIEVIVLDHHDAIIPKNYSNAIIINNNADYEEEE